MATKPIVLIVDDNPDVRRAIESDPKLANAHTNLGVVLGAQGKPGEAAAIFRGVVSPALMSARVASMALRYEMRALNRRDMYRC